MRLAIVLALCSAASACRSDNHGIVDQGIVDDHVHRDPRCGEAQPAEGEACTAEAHCEYGGDSLGRFATYASCGGAAPFTWQVYPGTPTQNPSSCPATYADATALTTCPSGLGSQDACDYDEGRCACLPCWRCRQRTDVRAENGPPGAVCPVGRPLSGDGCAPDGVICHYENSGCAPDPLGFGSQMDCFDGYWGEGGGGAGGCPSGC